MSLDVNNYAFIDGNYLCRAYGDTMRKFFRDVDPAHLDLQTMKRSMGTFKALMHAYRKNMWHASLVAGDLDFEHWLRS